MNTSYQDNREVFSQTAQSVESFKAMNVLERAQTLQAQGKSIIHLEIGEPDFATPEAISLAGIEAIRTGHTRYTPAAGIPELRHAITDYYHSRFGITVRPEQILATAGASGAIQLILMALLQAGDEVMIADPSYPCYRQLLRLYGMQPVLVPLDEQHDFDLTAELAKQHWHPGIKAVMIASPANPTGSLMSTEEIAELYAFCREQHAILIVDEIYQGLVYDVVDTTALSIVSGQQEATGLYVFNSFSKYFGMTGWRLGWLVASSVEAAKLIERLAQNLFIAPSTPAQYAALAAFQPETLAELEVRKSDLALRRKCLRAGITALGFAIMGSPDGAFYLYARLPESLEQDAESFALGLLEDVGVAVTPGTDFGVHEGQRYVRFAYTQPVPVLEDALQRIASYMSAHRRQD